MLLHAFYNKDYIGDILLVRLCDLREIDDYYRADNICVLKKDDEIVGYNIFEASSYFTDLSTGKIKITPAFVERLNELLDKYHLPSVESDYNDHFVVGKVLEVEEHPDSDHLHICQVDDGTEVLQIVCGAPNVAVNQLVVIAQSNAVMPNGTVIKEGRLRGIKSQGMLCSARELNLPNAPQKRGILVLDDHYKVGEAFFK